MKYILVMPIILCFFVLLPAQPPKTGDSGQALADDFTTFIGVNDILMFVTNRGNWGRDFTNVFGRDAGTFYRFCGDTACVTDCTYTASPYYSGGLWVGGIDSASGDTLLAISDFATEYASGPMSAGTFLPDDPAFRNYRLYADSLGDNPNADYLNWPDSQGAPVDDQGDPEIYGDHFLWSVYNDADASRHTLPNGSTAPAGIEVRQAVFAFENMYGGEAGLNATIFFRFRIFNKGAKTINDCYFTFWSDPDLGWATDDMVGCDTLRNLGFVYNGDDDDDGQYGATPPALGIDLLQGVKVYTGDDADTARQWGEFYAGWKDAGMTTFSVYIGGVDPASPTETYDLMRCTPGGNPFTYDDDTLTYMYSGNPVTASGDLCPFAGEYRFLVTTGPVTFRPGDSTEIVAAMVIGQSSDRLTSVTQMKLCDESVQLTYENGYQPTLDIDEQTRPSLPATLTLHQNYPNPFNPGTSVDFSLARSGQVELRIYNILGELIETLFSGTLPAGDHQVYWDGLDKNGQPVATGIYLYQLRQNETVITKKMILAK